MPNDAGAPGAIVSVSRRTDIPWQFMPWFENRLRAGFAWARNPMNPRQTRFLDLRPQAVAGLVFWSKNPQPLLERLSILEPYAYYVQFTLNAYGEDVEPGVPLLDARVENFRRLSDAIGPERVLWRYDPVALGGAGTQEAHLERFGALCRRLAGYTSLCSFSFLDAYAKIRKPLSDGRLRVPTPQERAALAEGFAQRAKAEGLALFVCAESEIDGQFGIQTGACVDAARLSRIAARPIDAARDKNQRPGCACARSVDIGMYHTCAGGCLYCYAGGPRKGRTEHDVRSPLL